MKLLSLILSILLVLFLVFFAIKTKREGLCGNYSLTYHKVKDLFSDSDISGIKQLYNMNYKKELLCK